MLLAISYQMHGLKAVRTAVSALAANCRALLGLLHKAELVHGVGAEAHWRRLLSCVRVLRGSGELAPGLTPPQQGCPQQDIEHVVREWCAMNRMSLHTSRHVNVIVGYADLCCWSTVPMMTADAAADSLAT